MTIGIREATAKRIKTTTKQTKTDTKTDTMYKQEEDTECNYWMEKEANTIEFKNLRKAGIWVLKSICVIDSFP